MTFSEYSFTYNSSLENQTLTQFERNFSNPTTEFEDIGSLNDDESINLSSQNISQNNSFSSTENNLHHQIDSNERVNSCPLSNDSIPNSTRENSIIGKKRKRKKDKDNYRKKIKRRFFNVYLINKLEAMLKRIGIKNYFRKFPSVFACDIDRKRCNKIFKMTLREIFENEEIYKNGSEVDLEKYKHNLKMIQSEKIKESKEFKIILFKTIAQIYKEYINSDEFNIDEINYLKENGEEIKYIEDYEKLAKNLIEFFESINK